MRKLKMAMCACVAALMVFGALALTGCGEKTDEDVIREGIAAELDSIKNMDQEFVDLLMADGGASEFAEYGISATDFMERYLDGFGYSIDSVNLDEGGEMAVVTVTLTCKSFASYMYQVQADSVEWAAAMDQETAANMTVEEANAAIGSILMGALDKVEASATEPITIAYKKIDGEWLPADGTEDAIASAMLSN